MIFRRYTKVCMIVSLIALIMLGTLSVENVLAAPLPGGTLDPLTVPKYVTPLVIPPVMNNTGTANAYDIAVRQFKQQILPGGIWNTLNGRADAFGATTVWSYGPKLDPLPAIAAPDPLSQFNYPAYTIETSSGTAVNVRWRNELVADPIACAGSLTPATDPACNFLPHLLPVDQTLHWANPPAVGCMDGTNRTDCRTANPAPYVGPVPIVTHVHGAHVDPHSDGYPEAWWLPKANNIPAGYAFNGRLFDDALGQMPGLNLGYADYMYRNDQPATTIWYHDHSLGMTRLNVYAGPAGFWLIRGGANDLPATLPGPAPAAGQGVLALNVPGDPVRNSIREIPVAIQDRSFNSDGSLFYPASRDFFDGYTGPYTGSSPISTDIAPIWNPEAFFNTIVVNGVTWPALEVAPALYRLRLLNGCNSRFLNLSLFEVDPATGVLGVEHPIYQIGAEQGFLPSVVKIQSGTSVVYDGTPGGRTVTAPDPQFALLMGLAERADVIVDFRNLPNGTTIQMVNTAPDAPFGGFPDVPADPDTTGQVMRFVVNTVAANAGGLLGASPTDPVLADGVTVNPNAAIDPTLLMLPAEAPVAAATVNRDVSLNEESSGQVCVTVDPAGAITVVSVLPPPPQDQAQIAATCAALGAVPMAPRAALVGTVDFSMPGMPMGMPLMWDDTMGMSTPLPVNLQNGGVAMVPVTENPVINGGVAPVENWNIYNFTMDAHPIHLHLVRFQVIDRQPIPGMMPAPVPFPQQPWETGFKDTVIAYPGEITTVRAEFDIEGLYVWHCHIVEHEDNEMMRPYIVSAVLYSISGTITDGVNPLAGVSVALSGASTATTTTDAAGNYSFAGLVNGDYTVTPTLAGYTFMPASAPVTVNSANVTNVNFAAMVAATYSISGTITDGVNPLASVSVALSGASTATTTTDAAGNYSFAGLANGDYTATPTLGGYTFTPASAPVTVNNADVTGVNFTATLLTYSISGTITDGVNPLAGVSVALSGASTATTTTDAAGNYSFAGLANADYTVTPTLAGYTFMPASTPVTVNNANVTNVNFMAMAVTYSISGTITSGATGLAGVTVALSGASTATTTTDASGNYSFTGLANGSYTVIPTLAGYTFMPASAPVTVNNANVTNVNFTAAVVSGPTITVIYPNGGETFDTKTMVTIRWSFTGNVGSALKIELLKGGVVVRTIAESAWAKNGYFRWYIPAQVIGGNDYTIRISSKTVPSATDTSDANFTINGEPAPSVTVISPNGGENWIAGTRHTIQWSFTGPASVGSAVKLELLKGGVLDRVITQSKWIGKGGNGFYSWLIPADLAAGADYTIRITSINGLTDTSDANFSIQAPTITVTSPNGGESWRKGTLHQITWNYTGPDTSLKINLLQNGTIVQSITEYAWAAKGSFYWYIGSKYAAVDNYTVQIESRTNPLLSDTSDANFSIVP